MKRRLILAFALLFGLFSIGIGASIYSHWQSSRQMLRVITGHQIEELRHDLSYRLHQSQRDLQASGTVFAAQLDDIIGNVEQLDRAVASCNGCHHSPEQQRQFQNIASLVGHYKDQFSTFITALLNPDMRQRLLVDANATAAEINLEIDRVLEPATRTLALRTRQALDEVDRSWRILAITLATTLVLAVLTTVMLVRGITEPVRTLVDATQRIHRGDLGFQIDHRERNELGLLMDSFNEMSAQLASDKRRLDGHVARLQLLNRAVFSLYATPDHEALRERLARAITSLFDVDRSATLLEAGLEDVFVMSLTQVEEQIPGPHHAFSREYLEKLHSRFGTGSVIRMSDIEGEWPLRLGDLDPPPKSVLLAWVEFDGEVHGALLALDKRTGEFVEDDAQVLEALAKGVAEAVENIRLYQDLQVRS